MAAVFELCLLATAGYTDQEFKPGPRSTFRSLFYTFSFATFSSYGGCAKDIQKGELTNFMDAVITLVSLEISLHKRYCYTEKLAIYL